MTDHPVLRDSGIARLQEQIAALRRLDFRQVRFGPMLELDALSGAIASTLEDCFGVASASCQRFLLAAKLAPAPTGPDHAEFRLRQAVRGNVQRAIALLEDAQRVLQERAAAASASLPGAPAGPSRRVLIVHGDDDGLHLRVVRFLAGVGLEALSLARSERGGTLIGRIEACHDAGFAVVLPTSGGTDGALSDQDELLELGYLMGRLGRTRVCVFARVGTPDLQGVLADGVCYIMGRTEDWQPVLGRALRSAGYAVDRDAMLRL
ncbi:MAG TPA: TIR domain-containing protein [Paraburkholderia sp.]|nr:TIR domain-containing protein [Paraburkholderia sp.]